MSTRRRSREEWSGLLTEFADSKLAVAAFSSERGINPGYFMKKRAQLNREKRRPFVR